MKNDAVCNITVPFYESLSVGEILAEFGNIDKVKLYLPEGRDLPKLPRAYLCNLINSIIGNEFRSWVQKRINDRNEILADEGDNNIVLDKDIADIFNQSTYVSSKSSTPLFYMNSA